MSYLFSFNSMKPNAKKIVVFDMDQTLGCFIEIGMFWEALNNITVCDDVHFFDIIDLFQEFLRPKILTLLKKILDKKANGKCSKILIYTNNNGPISWTHLIADYFEYKLGEPVFDVITAFKPEKGCEMCRTSEDKNIPDLIRCAKCDSDSKFCFFDDQFHPLMKDSNVYYVKVKPFTHSIPYKSMVEKYSKKYIKFEDREEIVDYIIYYMNKFDYIVNIKTKAENMVDEVVSKQMFVHIDKFFEESSKSRTLNKRRRANKKTIKHYRL